MPLGPKIALSPLPLRGAELKINVTDPKGSGAYLSFTNQFDHLSHWSLTVVMKVCALQIIFFPYCRHWREDEDIAFSTSELITPEFRQHVAKKLSKFLDSSYIW